MKKIRFNPELTNSLKNLLEKVGTGMTDESLSNAIAGGVCKTTCSWHCREEASSEILIDPPASFWENPGISM